MVEFNFMTTIKTAIVALMVSMFLLGACGRRGALQPAPDTKKEEKQDQKFILDPLIKS